MISVLYTVVGTNLSTNYDDVVDYGSVGDGNGNGNGNGDPQDDENVVVNDTAGTGSNTRLSWCRF